MCAWMSEHRSGKKAPETQPPNLRPACPLPGQLWPQEEWEGLVVRQYRGLFGAAAPCRGAGC